MGVITLFLIFITTFAMIAIPVVVHSTFYNPMCVSKTYFESVVNASSYFDEMNQQDLLARKAATPQEYKFTYMQSFTNFTKDENTLLKTLTYKADKILKQGFKRLYDIPWKFAKVADNIEEGFPHTLGDIIILSNRFFKKPSMNFMLTTLIHEKVHVLQRSNPEWATTVIKQWGFKEYHQVPNLKKRNNPDISNTFYGFDEGAIVQLYTTDHPTSLSQSAPSIIKGNIHIRITQSEIGLPSYINQIEHPYEIMACMVPELLIKTQSPSTHYENTLLQHMSS